MVYNVSTVINWLRIFIMDNNYNDNNYNGYICLTYYENYWLQ